MYVLEYGYSLFSFMSRFFMFSVMNTLFLLEKVIKDERLFFAYQVGKYIVNHKILVKLQGTILLKRD